MGIEDEKINFKFGDRELTAYIALEATEAAADPEYDDMDFELTDVISCEDSETGEEVAVTEGMKAAILFALREQQKELQEDKEAPEERFFKPDRR